MILEGVPGYEGEAGVVDKHDALEEYASYLRELVPVPTRRKLVVAVDAANGMAGMTVPAVLGDMDIRPLYFELDGTFPNHPANPLEPANLVDLQKAVREHGADIGLAFDGDADRCFVIDENGGAVTPSAIAAIVAEREIALMRALTEAVQVRTTYISGARDDLQPRDYAPEVLARRAWQAGRLRDAHRPVRDFARVPQHLAASFPEDLDWLLSRLCAVGLDEAIAVDLSRPELGLAVVRVAVPGLEGPDDHPDYRPGPRARAVVR